MKFGITASQKAGQQTVLAEDCFQIVITCGKLSQGMPRKPSAVSAFERREHSKGTKSPFSERMRVLIECSHSFMSYIVSHHQSGIHFL
jgi:hypothetical protein